MSKFSEELLLTHFKASRVVCRPRINKINGQPMEAWYAIWPHDADFTLVSEAKRWLESLKLSPDYRAFLGTRCLFWNRFPDLDD